MTKLFAVAAVPLLAVLGACQPANNVSVTNDDNVVLNDQQTNFANEKDEVDATAATANGANAAMPANATQ